MARERFVVVIEVDDVDEDDFDEIMEDLESGIEDHVEVGPNFDSVRVMRVRPFESNERL